MKSFLHGRKSLESPALRPPPAAPSASASLPGTRVPATHTHAHMPTQVQPGTGTPATVEVVKEGDKVVRLIVTCACGERVEVECLYPAGS
jgi:hypothetical protein